MQVHVDAQLPGVKNQSFTLERKKPDGLPLLGNKAARKSWGMSLEHGIL